MTVLCGILYTRNGGDLMFFDEAIEDKYNQVYHDIYETLKLQYATNKSLGVLHLQTQLEDLYVLDGNNMLGRNDFKSASVSANIAACETLLLELKAQL